MAHWLNKQIQNSLKNFPVVLISGPRNQSRNSIIKNEIPNNWVHINFEDPSQRKEVEKNIFEWIEKQNKNLYLEEIQHIPEIAEPIAHFLKHNPEKRLKCIMTSSIIPTGIESFHKFLSGRYTLISLFEIKSNPANSKFSPLKKGLPKLNETNFSDLYEEILSGASEGRPKTFYSKWLQNWIDRDLRNLRNIENLTDFQLFLEKLALINGKPLNMAEIAREINVSLNTIKAWVAILTDSWIIHLIKPFERDFKVRLKKAPYVYFIDTGLLCYLLDINNKTELEKSKQLTEILSSKVLTCLKQWFAKNGSYAPISIWQPTSQKYPCLLVETYNEMTAFVVDINSCRNSTELKELSILNDIFHKGIQINQLHLQNNLEELENYLFTVPAHWAQSW